MSSDQEEASHMIFVGEGSCRHGESPVPEVETAKMGSLQPMRNGVLHRPSNQTDYGMQWRNGPKTGRP